MPYSDPANAPSLSDLLSLKGRTALVVGGAGLLGGEISFAFAELGARVLVASRDAGKCSAFAKTLASRHPSAQPQSFAVDITDPASIRALAAEVKKAAVEIDILVNSGWSGRKNTFESISDEDWDKDIEVCLNGVFRTVKAFVPLLKPRRGNILSIASMYGHVA